jgi:hypothetical protein
MTESMTEPLFLVCEDGDEYTQRFERFLGREFRFRRATDGGEAESILRSEPVTGLLLDLDFSRTPADRLWGEHGPLSQSPTGDERARCATSQGILILQHLRRLQLATPALLFADLDDEGQVTYLESTLAPLKVVSSREGLAQIAGRLRGM